MPPKTKRRPTARACKELDGLIKEQRRDAADAAVHPDSAIRIRTAPKKSGVKIHAPPGFRDEAGWLVRTDAAEDALDMFVRARRDEIEGRSDATAIARAEHGVTREVVRRLDACAEMSSWWAIAIGAYLDLYARFPTRYRRTAHEIADLVADILAGAAGDGPRLLPADFSGAVVARHAGPRLERVTIASRGGGSGARARRSVDSIVKRMLQEASAARAGDAQHLLEAIMERRGVRGVEGLRRIVGGRAGPIRAALSDLMRRGLVVDRGTERHPLLFAVSKKSRSSR